MVLNWTCSQCGAYNHPRRRHCWNCGTDCLVLAKIEAVLGYLHKQQVLEASCDVPEYAIRNAQGSGKSLASRPALLFGISLLIFVFIGWLVWVVVGASSWVELVILILTLFLHECGHYVGMRVFGYRDVKMFFIPLFGAAVSGYSLDAPVIKEIIVLLLGPVPGLLLGYVFGLIYLITQGEVWLNIATILVFLNGINLLPLYPMDGGRIVLEVFGRRSARGDTWLRAILSVMFIGFALWRGWSWTLGLVLSRLVSFGQIAKYNRLLHRLPDALRGQGTDSLIPISYETALAATSIIKREMPDLTEANGYASLVVEMCRRASARALRARERWLLALSYIILLLTFLGAWYFYELNGLG